MIGWLAERAYSAASLFYHRLWDKRGGERVEVPVISVGNLTVGGNGKTPFVILLAKLLQENYPFLSEHNAIAILSRGYGRKSKELVVVEAQTPWQESGDEPLLIKRSVPSTLVIAHAKRIESARMAIDRFGSRLIILDDGFQHRPLARDIDLVLMDSESPLGNGHLLPVGTLREPTHALNRATALISVGKGSAVEPLAAQFGRPMFHVEPSLLTKSWGQSIPQPAYLVTGIARPERVVRLLESANVTLAGHKAFRDHHEFTANELISLESEALRQGAVSLLTTSKDMLRIHPYNGKLMVNVIPYELTSSDSSLLLAMLAKQLDSRLSSRS